MTNKNRYARRSAPEQTQRLQLLQEGIHNIDSGYAYFGGKTLPDKLSEIIFSDRLPEIMGVLPVAFKESSPISYDILTIAEYSSRVVLADLKSDVPVVLGWRMYLAAFSTNILANAITLAVLSDSRAFERDGSLSEEMLLWYRDFISELLTM